MDNNIWKETIQNLNGPLDLFFSELAKQKVSTKLIDASSGDKDQTLGYVDETKLFKSIDDGFQVEVLLGFKGDWPAVFHKPLQEREGLDDDADNIYSSLTAHLTASAVESMNRIGADLQVYPFSEVKKDPSLNIRTYYLSRWDLQVPGPDHKGDLEFVFIISVPNEKMIEKYSEAMANSPALDSSEFSAMAKETVTELLGNKKQVETEEKGEPIEEKPEPKEEEIEHEDTEEARPPHITDKNGHGANVEFEPFIKSHNIKNNREVRNIDMLRDVEMEVSVELGRKKMPLGKILQQVKGSVIELEKLSGEPVDILVNGRCIAVGDVVVIDEHFGVRITRLMAEHELMKSGSS
ncbi:MAG: flagellar motor switch protein FliN [Balneolales bacterium]